MTPLRAQMIRDMQLQRLAPQTQKAYVTAVAGLAKFYQCSPERLRPEQIRTYLHHLLTERRLAWSSCHQAAAGPTFFSTQTRSWDVLPLDLPPRTGRSQLPQGFVAVRRIHLIRCFIALAQIRGGTDGVAERPIKRRRILRRIRHDSSVDVSLCI